MSLQETLDILSNTGAGGVYNPKHLEQFTLKTMICGSL